MKKVSDIPSGDALRILGGESVVSGVNHWSQMHLSGARRPYQLAFYNSDEKIRRSFEVKQMPGGFNFLVYRGTTTEAMLDVTGLLIEYNLPPLNLKYHVMTSESLNYFVTLVAPQNEDFKVAQSALRQIFLYIGKSFAPGDLNSIKPHAIGDEGAIYAKDENGYTCWMELV
ncbi:hypothetical protein C0993_006983 [Termitomyces sp. T159_Od127]|nr:hypothetical protein C0993_006983 [Termitomyces sp. T159_Od127]